MYNIEMASDDIPSFLKNGTGVQALRLGFRVSVIDGRQL
jgi:hypothetical protein